MTKGYEK